MQGFCAFYCYDGLFRERPFEILAYVVAVIVIIVYTVGNFAFQFTRDQQDQPEDGERTLKIVRHILNCLLQRDSQCIHVPNAIILITEVTAISVAVPV